MEISRALLHLELTLKKKLIHKKGGTSLYAVWIRKSLMDMSFANIISASKNCQIISLWREIYSMSTHLGIILQLFLVTWNAILATSPVRVNQRLFSWCSVLLKIGYFSELRFKIYTSAIFGLCFKASRLFANISPWLKMTMDSYQCLRCGINCNKQHLLVEVESKLIFCFNLSFNYFSIAVEIEWAWSLTWLPAVSHLHSVPHEHLAGVTNIDSSITRQGEWQWNMHSSLKCRSINMFKDGRGAIELCLKPLK